MQVQAEETELQEGEHQEQEQEGQGQGETLGDDQTGAGEGQAEEVVVSIGDESPSSEEEEHQQAPPWLKDLRKENREKGRRIRELEEELAKSKNPGQPGDQLKKPSLTDPDIDFDEEKYERKFEAWQKQEQDRRAEADRQKAEQVAQENAWKTRVAAYDDGKAALKLADFDDAEGTVREAMNQTQMGIIIHGAKNPALVTYALGKAPAKLKELASIKDPIQFAFAVANLETQVKTTTRKAAPPAAEAPIRGNTPASLGGDAELTRLEAEAERTGDRTKVVAYRRQKLRAAHN